MSQQEGVVTPEAVLLEFQPAGIGSRTAALLIDLVILVALSLLVALASYAVGQFTGPLPGWAATTLLSLAGFAIFMGYFVICETLWGRTPGKAVFGLRVLSAEGGPIVFRQAVVRFFVAVFETFGTFGVVASVVSLASTDSKRAGDHAAGTMVLRERSAQHVPQSITFRPPAGAEDYASSIDVSSLTTGEYATIRSLLMRVESLGATPRARLSDQLGRKIAQKLNTQPPSWITAEGFLACVAAAYQHRFAPREQ